MKRSLFFGVVIGVVFSLALPFYSMAANVNIQTRDGYAVGINKPYITLFTDGSGNVIITLDAVKDEILPLAQFEPLIKIAGTGTNNLSGIVTVTKNSPVTFDVEATDSATASGGVVTLSYLGSESPSPFTPDTLPNKGTWTKQSGYSVAGTYLVSFGAITTMPAQGTVVGDSTLRTIQIAVTDPQACQSTVAASVTNPAGGSINAPTSVTTTCGAAVSFNGQINSGYTGATVTEGSFSPSGLTWNWSGITAPTTNGGTKNVSITFTGSTSCTSTVTASVTNPAGGSINAPTSVTTSCGAAVSFSGQINSGYTGATVTEGSFSPTGLTWNWTGIAAPATNGGSKAVSITFTTGSTPPPTGWINLNNRIGNTSMYGYNYSVGGQYFGPATGGQTYSFLIDPASVGYDGKPTVMVGDVAQQFPCQPHLYKLDAAGNRVSELPLNTGNNQWSNSWPKGVAYNSERLLLVITPVSTIQSMLVYWY